MHYAGATLQYGGITEFREDMSLEDGVGSAAAWLGWKTIIGPIFLGYGATDNGNESFYLNVGGHF